MAPAYNPPYAHACHTLKRIRTHAVTCTKRFGNSLGIVTRLFRANAGYYFGLFSKETAKELLFWNFATTSFFALITLAAAALPLIAEAM